MQRIKKEELDMVEKQLKEDSFILKIMKCKSNESKIIECSHSLDQKCECYVVEWEFIEVDGKLLIEQIELALVDIEYSGNMANYLILNDSVYKRLYFLTKRYEKDLSFSFKVNGSLFEYYGIRILKSDLLDYGAFVLV